MLGKTFRYFALYFLWSLQRKSLKSWDRRKVYRSFSFIILSFFPHSVIGKTLSLRDLRVCHYLPSLFLCIRIGILVSVHLLTYHIKPHLHCIYFCKLFVHQHEICLQGHLVCWHRRSDFMYKRKCFEKQCGHPMCLCILLCLFHE